jgi:hypothetical protein
MPENLWAWLTIAGFGAYHGLNPAMGWLFALALGLQQKNERAIWLGLVPISLGHALSVALTALAILALQAFVSLRTLQIFTAVLLLAFGIYKLFNWYRHPRWVGMRVNQYELVGWSFLMATAHGAGLMIAPALLGVMSMQHDTAMHSLSFAGANASLAIGLHTASMLLVMAVVAWVVYRKLGLMVLKKGWINFDLIWSVALLVVGFVALIVVTV